MVARFGSATRRAGRATSCTERCASGGYACDVIAPSLIPKRPGVQRKNDKRDAAELARLYRAGELTAVHIPSKAEERVRDVDRCRETRPHQRHPRV